MSINPDTGEIGVFFRTPYNYDTDQASDETGLKCEDETRTQQQFKDETDINNIVEKFGVTGELPPTMNFPEPDEFVETFDFQTAMNVIRNAEESFMTMPAKVRARFDNNPQKFMNFINDPESQDEAIKLGIARDMRKPKEEPKAPNPQGESKDT